MPRLPADPIGRLAVLEAARKDIGRKKIILNLTEMAKVAGMTERNFTTIVKRDEHLPVKQPGGMGVPWQFEAGKVLDHLIKQARAAQAEREARMARVTRLAGLGASAGASSSGDPRGAGSGTVARGDPADLLASAKAISAMVDTQAKIRGEKQAQGRLVDMERARSVLWAMLTTMQTETLAIASKMDPTGQWEPELRGQVEEELRNVLLGVRTKLETELEKLRGHPG